MPVFFEYLYTFSEEKNGRNGQNKGKAQAAIPSCFKGKGLEMMGGRSPSLISEAGREMWHLRALWRLVLRLAEKPHPANNTPPSPNIS